MFYHVQFAHSKAKIYKVWHCLKEELPVQFLSKTINRVPMRDTCVTRYYDTAQPSLLVVLQAEKNWKKRRNTLCLQSIRKHIQVEEK